MLLKHPPGNSCRAVSTTLFDVLIQALRAECPDGITSIAAVERMANRLTGPCGDLNAWYVHAEAKCGAVIRSRPPADRRHNRILRVLLASVEIEFALGAFDRSLIPWLECWLAGVVGNAALTRANDRVGLIALADAPGTAQLPDYRGLPTDPQVGAILADLMAPLSQADIDALLHEEFRLREGRPLPGGEGAMAGLVSRVCRRWAGRPRIAADDGATMIRNAEHGL